jgi:hypothetical protein
MKRRPQFAIASHLVLLVSFAVACSAADDDGAEQVVTERDNLGGADDTPEATTSAPASATCERGALETDFRAAPLAGAGVDSSGLRAGEYIVSSTYLQLKPDAQQTLEGLLQPVLEDLQTRDGLLALSLGQSEACGALRTLAVWRDDAAMIAFVTSPAHTSAMSRVTDVSRGGSVVTHWLGDATSATWEAAAQELGSVEGPLY